MVWGGLRRFEEGASVLISRVDAWVGLRQYEEVRRCVGVEWEVDAVGWAAAV